ncbi:MAG: 2-oxoacid:acceptor oxidoreductase family protein [Elusimicrobiota bacterium]
MSAGSSGQKKELIIAGHGGQGVLFAGSCLAQAVLEEGQNVTYFPAYGAEVRGGACYSMVVVSGEVISSPIVNKADILIMMNCVSWKKFSGRLKSGGVVVANSSLLSKEDLLVPEGVEAVKIFGIPVTDLAKKIGDERLANVVMLGACVRRLKLFRQESLEQALKVILKNRPEWIELNIKAVEEGINYHDQKETVDSKS